MRIRRKLSVTLPPTVYDRIVAQGGSNKSMVITNALIRLFDLVEAERPRLAERFTPEQQQLLIAEADIPMEQAGFIPWRSWYAAASAFQAHGHPELAETIAAMNEAELMTLSHYIERHLRTERVGDIFEP